MNIKVAMIYNGECYFEEREAVKTKATGLCATQDDKGIWSLVHVESGLKIGPKSKYKTRMMELADFISNLDWTLSGDDVGKSLEHRKSIQNWIDQKLKPLF